MNTLKQSLLAVGLVGVMALPAQAGLWDSIKSTVVNSYHDVMDAAPSTANNLLQPADRIRPAKSIRVCLESDKQKWVESVVKDFEKAERIDVEFAKNDRGKFWGSGDIMTGDAGQCDILGPSNSAVAMSLD